MQFVQNNPRKEKDLGVMLTNNDKNSTISNRGTKSSQNTENNEKNKQDRIRVIKTQREEIGTK